MYTEEIITFIELLRKQNGDSGSVITQFLDLLANHHKDTIETSVVIEFVESLLNEQAKGNEALNHFTRSLSEGQAQGSIH